VSWLEFMCERNCREWVFMIVYDRDSVSRMECMTKVMSDSDS
jgi:hypothetical protein